MVGLGLLFIGWVGINVEVGVLGLEVVGGEDLFLFLSFEVFKPVYFFFDHGFEFGELEFR